MDNFSNVVLSAIMVIAGAVGCVVCAYAGMPDTGIGCFFVGCISGFMTMMIL